MTTSGEKTEKRKSAYALHFMYKSIFFSFFRVSNNLRRQKGQKWTKGIAGTPQLGVFLRRLFVRRGLKCHLYLFLTFIELGRLARVLRVVRVPYVNTTYCREVYQRQSRNHRSFNFIMVTGNHICAGFE